MSETRKQISVALSEAETQILDKLRGSISKGAYLRELLLEKDRETMTLQERVTRLKQLFLETRSNDRPTEIGFSRKEESDIERMKRSEIGNLVGEITIHGARVLTHFLGLKIRWDEKELSIYGPGGGGPESDFLKMLKN